MSLTTGAPVVRDTIASGSGQISGGFTFQTATDLALLLRSGALPAPLEIIEERTVGPDLGQDSINALIESCPRSGPTVLSSIISNGAGNAPDLNNKARSVAV